MSLRQKFNVSSKIIISLLLAAYAGGAQAQESNNITQIIINFSNSFPAIYRMVTGFAYVMGLGLVFKAIYHLKVYGELRTMMSVQTSLKTPGTYLFVGAIFLYLPTAMEITLNSTFGYGNVLSYGDWVGSATTTDTVAMRAIGGLVQLIGIIAFIRGWILVTKGAAQGAQPGTGNKGLMHIIGGLCAVNIYGFANLVYNSLGISFGG